MKPFHTTFEPFCNKDNSVHLKGLKLNRRDILKEMKMGMPGDQSNSENLV